MKAQGWGGFGEGKDGDIPKDLYRVDSCLWERSRNCGHRTGVTQSKERGPLQGGLPDQHPDPSPRSPVRPPASARCWLSPTRGQKSREPE